jgi:transcriptional regulator with XRE-family HTH domain
MSISTHPSAARPQIVPIGELLRAWRQRRNLSQLELALDAHVSTRHVSFVETGRAQPSREMIVRLAEPLEIPLRERNRLLLAAGYAPLYPQTPLDAVEMAPLQRAIDRFLRAHEPYPAIVLDHHYTLIDANDATNVLTRGVAAELLKPPANTLRITLHPDGMAPRIVNFSEWSAHLLHRLRRQATASDDHHLKELYKELIAYPGVSTDLPDPTPAQEIILPLRLRDHDHELAFFSTISTFGTANDITISELAIEAFYPANPATANQLLDAIT